MLNDRWAKRILRAAKTEVTAVPAENIVESRMVDREIEIMSDKPMVKDHEKLMDYLQKDCSASGHAHHLDFLLASLNVNQHLREAFLHSSVTEDADNNAYVISFPFGVKNIEYKLSKKAVDAEQ